MFQDGRPTHPFSFYHEFGTEKHMDPRSIAINGVGDSISDYSSEPLEKALQNAIKQYFETFKETEDLNRLSLFHVENVTRHNKDDENIWVIFSPDQYKIHLEKNLRDIKKDTFYHWRFGMLCLWIVGADNVGFNHSTNIFCEQGEDAKQYYWEI